MRIVLALAVVLGLAACSKSDDPNVAKADADLKAAGAATGDAADNLAAAAAKDTKDAAAAAAEKTGSALQDAGAKVKQSAADAKRNSGD